MSKGNVSLVDGHIDEPSVDAVAQGWYNDAVTSNIDFDIIKMMPFTVRFDRCEEVIFRVGEIEVKINFSENIPLDKIDAIIINGHKFVRDRDDRE